MELSPILRDWIPLIAAKRAMLATAGEIKTLVVGSSHGDFGFDPQWCPGSFNLCCRSQDLKHSFLLYQKISKKRPSIRNLVIFYSVFSSGHELEKSPSEAELSVAMNELFGLNIEYGDPKLKAVSKQLQGKLRTLAPRLAGTNGFLPRNGKGFFPASYGADRRARDHLRRNNGTTLPYLAQILRLAKANRHRAYIVIPPARSDYRAATGPGQAIFSGLRDVLTSFEPDYPVPVVDLYDSPLFNDAEFGDYDHLKPTSPGVEVLSKAVAAAVN